MSSSNNPLSRTVGAHPASSGPTDSEATDVHHTAVSLSGGDGVDLPTPDCPPGRRYTVLRLHARGALGEIFLAYDVEVGREVALKQMQPEVADDVPSRSRFLREAEITGRLEHPGVVPVYGLGVDACGRPFYAMRYIEGQTLLEAVNAFHRADRPGRPAGERSLALRRLLQRFVAVCQTVAYAHSKGVLHRDLKPSNILLGRYGEALVVDWGLARRCPAHDATPVDDDQPTAVKSEATVGAPATDITLAGEILGTPAYMSPEQAGGRWDTVGPASDQYSLGATLYHLLTGQAPFDKAPWTDMRLRIEEGDCRPPRQVNPSVPAALDAVCRKAMSVMPGHRYPDVASLAAELERWLADEPVLAYPEPALARLSRWARRHRTLVTSAAALVLAGVLGLTAALVLIHREKDRTQQARNEAEVALGDLKRQQEKTEAALEALQEQQKKTRAALQAESRRREQAWAALEGMTSFVIEDLLGQQVRLNESHRRYLRQVLEQYEQLARESGDDADSRTAVAAAYFRVGYLRSMLGQTAEAVDAYREARSRSATLVKELPDEPSHRSNEAAALSNLAQLLNRLGRLPEAEESLRQAISAQERLCQAVPDSPLFAGNLAASQLNLGTLLMKTARPADALPRYRAGLELYRRLAAEFPREPARRASVAETLCLVSDARRQLGQAAEAEKAVREALTLLQQLRAEKPTDPQVRSRLASGYASLSNLMFSQGQLAEAEKAAQEAVALRRGLAAELPGMTEHQASLAEALAHLAGVVEERDRHTAAEPVFRDAVALSQALCRDFPTEVRHRDTLSTAQTGLGRVLHALGRDTEAAAVLRSAIPLREQLVKAMPKVPYHRIRLADAWTQLGFALGALHQHSQAETALRNVVALRQELAREAPGHPDLAVGLGGAYCNLGLRVSDAGRPDASLEWFDRAIATLKPLATRTDAPPNARSFLGNSHAGRAYALTRLDRHGEAVAEWDQAIANTPPAHVPGRRLPLTLALARAGELARLLTETEALARQRGIPGPALETLARACALGAADGPDGKETETLASRAVQLLRRAGEAGHLKKADAPRLEEDRDFESLRKRPDFRTLLEGLK